MFYLNLSFCPMISDPIVSCRVTSPSSCRHCHYPHILSQIHNWLVQVHHVARPGLRLQDRREEDQRAESPGQQTDGGQVGSNLEEQGTAIKSNIRHEDFRSFVRFLLTLVLPPWNRVLLILENEDSIFSSSFFWQIFFLLQLFLLLKKSDFLRFF